MNDLFANVERWVRDFVSNPYVSLSTIILAVISVIYSYYLYRKSLKYKYLSFNLTSLNIVRNSKSAFPKLSISYESTQLDTLTTSNIVIRNYGTDAVTRQDIAPADPIRISTRSESGEQILDYEVSYTSNPTNKISANKVSANIIEITFDFLDPNDYVMIKVLHTGVDSQALVVNGTVIGATKPFVPRNLIFPEHLAKNPFFSFYSMIIRYPRATGLIMFVLMALFSGYFTYRFSENIILAIICLVPTLFFSFIAVASLFKRRRPEYNTMMHDFMESMMDTMFDQARKNTSSNNINSKLPPED